MLMKNLKKSSFSLLELLIAIVVVGIAVTSIPMLLNSSSKSIGTNLESTVLDSAYSSLMIIEMLDWDENNTKDDNFYKVLTADGGDDELKCVRKGTKELDNESGADCDDNKTSHIGIDDGEDADDSTTFDDVDDFNGYSITNLANYDINVTVKYVDDSTDYSAKNIFYNDALTPSNNTNIKLIELNITDKSGNSVAILRGESMNIGAVKIYSRSNL